MLHAPDPHHGLVRGLRAAVLTVPAVGIAALAHDQVNHCVDPAALLLAGGLCWPAAVAVLGARRRTLALLAWLVVAQVVTHVLLQLACHDPRPVGTRVLLAHGAAVLVTGLLLGRADAGLWTARALLRTGVRLLYRLCALLRPVTPAWPATARPTPVRRMRRFLVRLTPRVLRGPPSWAAPLTS